MESEIADKLLGIDLELREITKAEAIVGVLKEISGQLELLNTTLARLARQLDRRDELQRPKLTETLVQFDPADFERQD